MFVPEKEISPPANLRQHLNETFWKMEFSVHFNLFDLRMIPCDRILKKQLMVFKID